MKKNKKEGAAVEPNRRYEHISFEDDRLPIRINFDSGIFHLAPQREPFSFHEQIEILFVRRGEITVYASARPLKARAGELVVINPNQMHRVDHEGGEVGYDCLMMDAALYRDSVGGLLESRYLDRLSDNRLCFENLVADDREATAYVEGLCREFQRKENAYELAVKSHVLGLLSCLFRRHVSQGSEGAQMARNVERARRIRPALEYMNAHLSRHVTLEELAKSCNLSQAHFCRVFNQITSLSPKQYLNSLRLDRAAQLLKTQDKSVGEIAWETGFEDASYLSRRFKEKYGLTPRQLREKQ